MAKSDSQDSLEDKETCAVILTILTISILEILRERKLVQDGEPWMVADKPDIAQVIYRFCWKAEDLFNGSVVVLQRSQNT